MAGAKLNRARMAAVRVAGAGLLACAQLLAAQNGALCGRLTDLHSTPMTDVTLTARNEATGEEAHTTTAKNGAYCFATLAPGSYTLTADSPRLGQGQLREIVVEPGCTARVQAAMTFTPAPVEPLRLVRRTLSTETQATPLLATVPTPMMPLFAQTPQTQSTPPPEVFLATLPARISARAQHYAQLETLPTQTIEPTMETASPPMADPSVTRSVPVAQSASRAEQAGAEAADTATTLALSSDEIHALPTSGRHWEEFAQVAAATTPEPPSDASEDGGTEPAETTIDGVSTRLAYGRANSRNRIDEATGEEAASVPTATVSAAAVGALRTSASNAASEDRRAAGGGIHLRTARGGDKLHGQAFYYDRQNNWGARNPFTQWIEETTAGTATTLPTFTATPYTPPSHEMSGGLGVGGPLRRNRMSWFAALDGLRNSDPGVSTVKHPALFFARPTNDRMQLLGAQIGSENAAIAKYSQMLERLDGLLGEAARTRTQWSDFGRFDWKLNERQTLTATLSASAVNAPGGGLTRTSEAYGTHSYGNASANRQRLLGRWEYFLTPNLLSMSEGALSHTVYRPHPGTPSSYEQSLDINVWEQLPQIVIDSSNGFTIGNPARFGQGDAPNERQLHAQQSLSWVHGSMLVNAGVQVEHAEDRTTILRNLTGTYHYANVANFITDALAFASYGIGGALDANNPHTCDERGKVWRDSSGGVRGLGSYPCYSYYTQTMGPTNRSVSTNEWAGYATAQWQPKKFVVLSAGLRWERTQLPPAMANLLNSELPLAAVTPSLGNNWGPRVSIAIGGAKRTMPTLRLGYGMYYAQLANRTLMTAMSTTGSANGDLNFYLRPTDNRTTGGAPPFPYVFAGEPLSIVKPGVIEFAQRFRSTEVHQAMAALEQEMPGKLRVTAAAMLSLGRRLPVTTDTNLDTSVNPGTITYAVVDSTGKGPIKASELTVPLYASWPSTTGTAGRANANYQQIVQLASRANSTYEAAMVKLDRYGQHGLSLHASYTYAHAMDWNPNEGSILGTSVLDPNNFALEYGTSNLDTRHTITTMMIYNTPWKFHHRAGKLANGWMLSGIGRYHSGLPYTMRTAGSLPKEFTLSKSAIVGLGSSLNGLGGDNRIYGTGSNNVSYNLGRNTYRYPYTWKADLRLAKNFHLDRERELQLLAESFNLFNHQNVTEISTTGYRIEAGSSVNDPPTLTFMNGATSGSTAFGAPLNVNSTNFYRERQIEFGLRLRF
jgi:hypothetical protein